MKDPTTEFKTESIDYNFLFPHQSPTMIEPQVMIQEKPTSRGSSIIKRMKSWSSPIIPSPQSPVTYSNPSQSYFQEKLPTNQRPELITRRSDQLPRRLPSLESNLSRLSWGYGKLASEQLPTQQIGLGFELPPTNLNSTNNEITPITTSPSTSSLSPSTPIEPITTLLPPDPFFARNDQSNIHFAPQTRSHSNSDASRRSTTTVFSTMATFLARSRSSSVSSVSPASVGDDFGALFESRKRGFSSSGGLFSSALSSKAGSTTSLSGGFKDNLIPPTILNAESGRRQSISSASTQSSNLLKVSSAGSATPTIDTINELENERKKLKKMKVGELVEDYVNRLVYNYPGEVIKTLATSTDEYHTEALTLHLTIFDFSNEPLDISLRKFLFSEILPLETFAIDIAMEAFSRRYHSLNTSFYPSSDITYIISFSLLLLNSDLWNGSNKVKMSKEAYIKNTVVEGVDREILEYLYDQVSASQFQLAHDLQESSVPPRRSESSLKRPELQSSGSSFFGSKDKILLLDPYTMIETNTIKEFQLPVDSIIPQKSPFSYTGTTSFLDLTLLRESFANATILEVPNLAKLVIVKSGLLSRKEDIIEGGRKSPRRGWSSWTVFQTTSQLLFFKDASMINNLTESVNSFKPDAVLSLSQSVALFDSSYSKYPNVFRLASADRQYLFQVSSELEMNSWISSINLAASYKSAGLKIIAVASTQRSDILNTEIQAFENEILTEKIALQSLLQYVRHLSVLTPILKSTRDRLNALLIQDISKRIFQFRINLSRLTLYREVLSRDCSTVENHSLRRSRSSSNRLRSSASMLRSSTEPTNIPEEFKKDSGAELESVTVLEAL